MRFFKMANCIFNYSLSPKGFIVYSYLISRMNVLQTIVISYQAIAEACHIDPKTACKAVDELTSRELIIKEHRYNIIGYAKNKYTVKKLAGGWFMVEPCIFKSEIKPTDFMVYCYIRKCMDGKHEEAFPSLSSIAHGARISRSRVAVAIRYLREFTYINRVKRHYKKTRAYRHNRYMKFKLKQKKKEARSLKRVSFMQKLLFEHYCFLISILKRIGKIVKLFFFSRGSPDIS